MGLVSLPNTSYTDTSVSDAADVMSNVYDPQPATPSSMEVVNGWLDNANLASGLELGPTKFKEGEFFRYYQATASAPYDIFAGPNSKEPPVDDGALALTTTGVTDEFVWIPGACVTFRVPDGFTTMVATWNISLTTDGDAASEVVAAVLSYYQVGSNAPVGPLNVASQRRSVMHPIYATKYNGQRALNWQGSWVGSTLSGWVTMGIRVGGRAVQTRVRNRSIRVILLK